jgi:riboflavin synthase
VFTGLILEMGELISLKRRSGGGILTLKADRIATAAAAGDSIAINGVCLTVVLKNSKEISFDLSDETLGATNLGRLKPGDRINLESSLTPASKMGGHFVTGHVDSAGKIRSRETLGDMLKFEIEAPPDVLRFLVRKGSVAVDGISLTVVDILKDGFTLIIIPHTAGLTTLGFKGPGDTVNLETDILGKYVAKFMNGEEDINDKNARFMDSLMKGGYV